ncbi:hypothetical protein ASE36_00090 [Rhizobium sp. Root274]|uniref:N-acetylmuramidase domain-containing protein n=1 Tax=unclassified Rhizobium TaxID=2613769 RepID=UPI000714551E|nr:MULTISPECIES: N-acetylmuramidase domain-containing protein [unclassified Rhizobium]KQW30739.1 hypothetical protein ASC71_00090 [Rhizobium sp. Root1240]KRD32286.1 hypothetical protein ASE36_00090 [Rhizobium sp. Root274]
MNFIGTGHTLSGEDFARAAATIGCDDSVIRAVTVVEARGQGFDTKKRPVMLFEPHVFWRCLPKSKRGEAQRQGLAYPKWKPGNYPDTQDERYVQLARAMVIDRDAALKACSWGIGQVLGENWEMCKFNSVEAFVRKNQEGEGGQLDVMVAFIIGAGLRNHLRNRNWAAFARGYNGPKFAENKYDQKLATAHDRIIRGAPAAYNPLADGLLSIGDKGDVVKALQRALGLHADGDFGPLTAQAVERFQREHGLTQDGKVGKQTGSLLGLHFWGSAPVSTDVPVPAPAAPTPVAPEPTPDPKPGPAKADPVKVWGTIAFAVSAAAVGFWDDLTTWIGGLFQ